MNRKGLAGATAALFVLTLVLAAAGWDRYVVMRHPAPGRLTGLIVTSPPSGYAKKPANSHVVTTDSSPFAAYKAAAKRSPSETASYSLSWSRAKQSDDSATVLLSYLPSAADATKVEAQAESQFLARGSYKAENYSYAGVVAVDGIPGAKGAVFVPTSGATPPVASVAFVTGRVQALVLLGQAGTSAATGRTAADLARAEYHHLQRTLPGFHLGVTAVPPVASAVYWAVVLGVLGLAVVIPVGVRRTRRRRLEARRRTARRQHQVRGSKIARRQAARRR
ncbi:MAG TPA: hypothetical protein VFH58_10295 [Acidimicrobiales bacterium]|nr:hypothetical protein [Acidimicrobiales bacterium]